MTKIIKALLDFTLGLWNERYDALHGAIKEEDKKKKKMKRVEQVVYFYKEKDTIHRNFKYLFAEGARELYKESSKYLSKWLATVELMDKRLGKGVAYTEYG